MHRNRVFCKTEANFKGELMILIESPSAGDSLQTWEEYLQKLKAMPVKYKEVRLELNRAQKMIEMLKQPIEQLTEEQVKSLFG